MTINTFDTLSRERAIGATGNLTFFGVVRGEWIKLLSLRSIRWSMLVVLLVSWGGATLMGFAMRDFMSLSAEDFPGIEVPGEEMLPGILAQAATFGSNITVLIMAVIGVLSMTSEYSSGLILSSLSAVPKRTPLLAAKAIVVAAIALITGAVSTIGGGIIAALILGGESMELLFQEPVLVSMTGAVLFLTLAALISLGLGALLRSSAGGIAVAVLLLFVATLVFQILAITGWEWVPQVAEWMPADLGYALANSSLSEYAAITGASPDSVAFWPALGGLVAWAAAALIPAAILLKTRDAM